VLQVAAVLRVMVEASSALDAQALCSLLQLNTWCRKAVLGSRTHHSISIKAAPQIVAGFTAWLPRHAGLFAGLQLVRPDDSPEWKQREADGKSISTALTSALQQCSAAAHAVPPFSTSAAHPAGTAEAPTMPLLLTSFSSKVYVTPAVLQGLPCATLTCLELDQFCRHGYSWYGRGVDIPTALPQLSNLRSLHFRSDLRLDWGCPRRECLKRLPHLPPLLTRLNIGPVETANTSILPSSLVELKLMVIEVRDTSEDPYSDDDEWVQPEPGQHLFRTVQVVDLSHLPLLQRCELKRTLSGIAPSRTNYLDTMTVQFAAPHLTWLDLRGNFDEVLGLPSPCALQGLILMGGTIRASRLAQLISGMPELVECFYNGTDLTFDQPWFHLSCPLLAVPINEQQLVAEALGSATKLTWLFVDGLKTDGHLMWGEEGLVKAPRDVFRIRDPESSPSSGDEAEQGHSHVNWGQHISQLVNLIELRLLVKLCDSDVLQFTTLTALTLLDAGWNYDHNTLIREQVQPHLPALEWISPYLCLDYSW